MPEEEVPQRDVITSDEIQDIMAKYKEKMVEQMGGSSGAVERPSGPISSKEYLDFKKESLPLQSGLYEKGCNFAAKLIKIEPKKDKAAQIQEALDVSHINTTPAGVTSFSIIVPMIFVFIGLIFFMILGSMFFMLIFVLTGFAIMGPLAKYPDYAANSWRMKASNQMVLSIFYVVTYMRHTSNLELAISFASDHLTPPLSLDLKRVVWNIETEKYESIKESLDMYLETWRKWNLEFIEAFHLIESSLFEGAEERRLNLLDKSLDVMLTETFEKMLHFAHNLKGPITMLHMMGVILPILGLVILPMVVSFMEGVHWYHIAALYNFIIPVSVFYMGKKILSTRPTGYGDTDISEENPDFKKFRNIIFHIGGKEIQLKPIYIAIIVFSMLFLLALSPLIIHMIIPNPEFDIPLGAGFKLLEYRESTKITGLFLGPFGMGSSLLSLGFPLAFGVGIGMYYKLKSKNVIAIRTKAKKLEGEFASALFQLGNRLGDGLPAELAFDKVANIMEDTVSGQFFKLVSTNITKMGMGVDEAIFNPKSGALISFPSNIIESSMKVLVESIKKGPKVAAQALVNISRYIKEIHKVDERLKDLMADIVSSMNSQIKFMSPAISGIVIGITSMITTILGALGSQMKNLSSAEGAGRVGGMTSMFGDGIPTYYFQLVVGVYVAQIVFVLTILSNGIENGSDSLNERYLLGQNLMRSTILYCIIASVVMILFNLIAGKIMVSTTSMG